MTIPLKKIILAPPTAVTANSPSGRMEEIDTLVWCILLVYYSDWLMSFSVLALA